MAKAKNTGLGRGLDAIFVDNAEDTAAGVTMLRTSDIEPRADQPRKHFDNEALSALAASISEHGMIQPIVVRTAAGGFYEIIAGERRWRAAKMAGISEVPVIISDFDDKKTAEVALIENIQRENLSAVEEAMGYRALMDEYGLTQQQVADRVAKSRSAVANTLRLLDLPDSVLILMSEKKLSEGHGRALLGLNDKDKIHECARLIISKELSVRAAEDMVRAFNRAKAEPAPKREPEVDYVGRLEKRAQMILGRKVHIIYGKKAKKVELTYENDDDLEALLTALCGKDVFEN